MGNSNQSHVNLQYNTTKLYCKNLSGELHSCRFVDASFGKIKCSIEKSQLTILEERYFNYEIVDDPHINQKEIYKFEMILPKSTESYHIQFPDGNVCEN
jgi:hypothetical protein